MECSVTKEYYSITSSYFILYGFFGCIISNPYVMDINALHFSLGILLTVFHARDEMTDRSSLPITFILLLLGIIAMRLTSEILKKSSGEKFDIADFVSGIRSEKFYRLPSAIISTSISSYITLAYCIGYVIYWVIPMIIYNTFCTWYISNKHFPSNTTHHSKVGIMFLKTLLATVVSCIGIGTSHICFDDGLAWISFFVGYTLINISLPYCIFMQIQYIILMRSVNLKREVSIIGQFLFVVRYLRKIMDCNV